MPVRAQPAFVLLIAACIAAPSVSRAVEVETGTSEGIRVLTISGAFTSRDDPGRLARSLAAFRPDIVAFDSPGGNIYSAMSFGRTIRTHGATTVQVRGMECASACALAFLGGTERYAEPGSIGMHKTSFAGDYPLSAADAVSAVQSATADVLAYLGEMGVDPSLLQLALSYDSWDIRYLSGSEMAAFAVVTGDFRGAERMDAADLSAPVARRSPPSGGADRVTRIEDARHGFVRRPKGYAMIMAEPSASAREVRMLPNATPVAILGATDRWYRVRSGADTGWMHHTWLKVAEFHDAGFEAKHVQIKSFDNGGDARAYLARMPLPLDVYVATNGWLAVTLDGTFTDAQAGDVLARMKSADLIPADSFQTFGNTYMEKLCCD